MDGLLIIAMNKHREICSIQSSGGIMLLKEQVHVVRLMQGTSFLSLIRPFGGTTKLADELNVFFFYTAFVPWLSEGYEVQQDRQCQSL